MAPPIDGILLVDKNAGESSHDVVRTVKKTLGLKKVGHAGTLDPFATGLLVILLNQGTKLSPFLMATRKVYHTTMRLGVETDTLDLTGNVIGEAVVPELGPDTIAAAAEGFLGETEQAPPKFSAVRLNGKRAYALAREGKEFDLEKRRVVIHSLKILDVHLPDLTLEVECSSGTYIRGLARDLGRALGSVGHLRSLRRTASGRFHVSEAVDSKEIPKMGMALLNERVISLNEAMAGTREVQVSPDIAEQVRQGRQSALKDIADGLTPADNGVGGPLKIVTGDELVAVVKVNKSRRTGHVILEIARVFT